MSEEEDWEKWADDDNTQKEEVEEQPKQTQQKQAPVTEAAPLKPAEEKSKEQDMNNVFDLFGGDKPLKKNIGQADLKKIGENFAAALQNVGPDYTNDFLKTLLSKLEGKLLLKHYEELFKLVEEVYVRKRKQFEAEEAIKKKSLQQGPPKGVSFGKTKNLVQDDEEDFDNVDDDDDDFM